MATSHLVVLSADPCEPKSLAPTPSVTETDAIVDALKAFPIPAVTNLLESPHRILWCYRGWNLYCAGGVTVYRDNPRSPGGNGYAGDPLPGSTEQVTINCASGWYRCQVKFGTERFTPDSVMGQLWKDVWKHKELGNRVPLDIQNEYINFCRKFKITEPCWEPIEPYPVPKNM
jgi:hypothetical protein